MSPPFTRSGNHLPVDRPLEKGTWTDPTAGLTSSGMDPDTLSLTLWWDPPKQLLQKQPLNMCNSVGIQHKAQQSLLLCFPSRLAPLHPRSRSRGHCAGTRGSDCLAAPADGWHQPRAASPGRRAHPWGSVICK